MQEFDIPEDISVEVVTQMTAKGKCGSVIKVLIEVLGAERGLHLAEKIAK